MTPEQAVIGSCLLDERVIRQAVEHVMPSDFATWQGEQIFSAIIALHSQKQPVDVVTVAAQLAREGSRVDPVVLHQAVAATPTAANVSYYAQEVREVSVRRQLRAVAGKLAQWADDETVPAAVTIANSLQDLKHVRDDAPDNGLLVRSLGDVMAEEDSYDWVVQRLFERGDRFILTGGEGAGKSMMIRQIAILAAAGIHPFWLHDIPPVKVMVLDRENSELQWRRKARALFDLARKFGKGDVRDLQLSCDFRPLDITKDSDLGMIHKKLDDYPADILALGPLYKLVPRAIMNDNDAAPLLAAMDSLRERGCVLITEAHAGNERDKSLRPVGSSAFMRWPEFGRGLRRDPAIEGRWGFEKWRGDRDDRSFPVGFTKGGIVPWTADGLSPGIINQFKDQPQLEGDNGSYGF
jgi:hypothetical protein